MERKDMEANYKTADGRITFKVSGGNVKEIFFAIADLQQIFEAETHCRICNEPNPKFRVRPTDKGEYYEVTCANAACGARFDFGQLREGGGLFPKRKDGEGNLLPDGGWYIYQGSSQPRSQQQPPPARQAPAQGRAPAPRAANPGPPPPPPPGDRW